ncbi:Mov34/MPN/PAD-1 family protein [Nannocystaceae bacterium ST9]
MTAEQLALIYRQARAEHPKECCGFVLGRGPTAEVVACVNHQDRYHAVDPETWPRTSANAYMFAAKDVLRLDRSLGSEQPATIVYHSHPRVGAYFSDEDVRAALASGWPVDYLVVDCQDDEIREAKLFRREGERFVEIERFAGAKV